MLHHILTSRLILRPLHESDGPALAAATDETWDDLSRWMRWATDRAQLTEPANCAAYAKTCHEKFHRGEDFTFGAFLQDSGDFVLLSRLAHLDPANHSYEFCGYWCRKKYQGQGFMTEAVRAVIDYAFNELHAAHLQIKHAAGNDKTRAVMDRVGFVEEKILSAAHQLPDGSRVDEHVLGMRRPAT